MDKRAILRDGAIKIISSCQECPFSNLKTTSSIKNRWSPLWVCQKFHFEISNSSVVDSGCKLGDLRDLKINIISR